MVATPVASLGLDAFASSISRLAGRANASGATQHSLVYMLQHFETTAFATMSSPTGQQIMKRRVPSITQFYPVLLHSVLAFSATHLRHLGQLDPHINMAAWFHTQRALELYSSRLRQHTILDPEMDAMFAACLMLTALSFVAEGSDLEDPAQSWTLQPQQQQRYQRHQLLQQQEDQSYRRWITTASGLTILLGAHPSWNRSQSIWLPFLLEASCSQRGGVDDSDLRHLPPMLLDLCTDNQTDPPNPNPYTPTLRILGSMFCPSSPPAPTNKPSSTDHPVKPHIFPRLISFPSRLPVSFTDLVYAQDSRALLILAHWFTLVARHIPHWWCYRRVRGECWAICGFLKEREEKEGKGDGRMREMIGCLREGSGL